MRIYGNISELLEEVPFLKGMISEEAIIEPVVRDKGESECYFFAIQIISFSCSL